MPSDIVALRYAVLAADTLSFARAATQVRVKQVTLSRRVAGGLTELPGGYRGNRRLRQQASRLPRATRTFAIELAARMRDQGTNRLPVDDVEAFEISTVELKRQLEILEHHRLGDADDHFGQWVSRLYERDPGGPVAIPLLRCLSSAMRLAASEKSCSSS